MGEGGGEGAAGSIPGVCEGKGMPRSTLGWARVRGGRGHPWGGRGHPKVGEERLGASQGGRGYGEGQGCPSRGGPRGGRQGRAAGLEELECPVLGRNPPPKPSSGRLGGGRWGYKDILATKKPSLSSAASPVATSRHRQP